MPVEISTVACRRPAQSASRVRGLYRYKRQLYFATNKFDNHTCVKNSDCPDLTISVLYYVFGTGLLFTPVRCFDYRTWDRDNPIQVHVILGKLTFILCKLHYKYDQMRNRKSLRFRGDIKINLIHLQSGARAIGR